LPKNLGLWVYLHTAQATFGQLIVTVSSTSNLSKYFRVIYPFSISAGTIARLVEGWNFLPVHRDDLTNQNNESWNNTMILLKIQFSSTANTLGQISIDSMVYDVERMARCIFTFDGFRQSVYNIAYPIMNAAGIRGTVNVVSYWVGTNASGFTYATEDMIRTLYNDGWTIGNHTDNHPNLTTLDANDIKMHVTNCKNWLISKGFTKYLDYFAYPNGTWNSTVVGAIAACGIKASRTTSDSLQFTTNLLLLQAFNIANTTPLANVKTMIDYAIKYGGTIIFYFDGVYTDTPVDTLEWSLANFQALIDHIVACKIKCVTIDEFYQGLTNRRYRSIPLTRNTI